VGQVFAYSQLRPTARFVLLAISQATFEKTRQAQIGEPELCDMTGLTRWTVYRAITDAEEAGELFVDRSTKPNTYTVMLGIHDDMLSSIDDFDGAETRDPRSTVARYDPGDVAETRVDVAETRDPRSTVARYRRPLHSEQETSRPALPEFKPPPALTPEEQARAAEARREVIAQLRSDHADELVPDHLSLTVNKAGPADRRRRRKVSS
jgi:hypothetical protein